jgi:hypothetical protein
MEVGMGRIFPMIISSDSFPMLLVVLRRTGDDASSGPQSTLAAVRCGGIMTKRRVDPTMLSASLSQPTSLHYHYRPMSCCADLTVGVEKRWVER